MVLVLLFCTVLIIVTLFLFLIILSTLSIEIKNYMISNFNRDTLNNNCKNKDDIKSEYKINISLKLLDKFKFLNLKLNEEKIKKISFKMHLDNIDIKKIEKEIGISDMKEIIQIKPKISYLDLKMKIGTDDVLITSYLVPIICIVLSLLLPILVEKDNLNKISYSVNPIYNRGNVYDIRLETEIKIKMIRSLNAIYRIYKQRGNKRKEKRNSIEEERINKNNIKCNV